MTTGCTSSATDRRRDLNASVTPTLTLPEQFRGVLEDMTDSLRSDLAHLYRRAGFGATAAELDAAEKAGYAATVKALVRAIVGVR